MITTQRRVGVDVGVGVDEILLERPAKRNALTLSMWQALPTRVAELEQEPGGDPVVLRGAGGYFSAGADLDALATARSGSREATEFATTLTAALLSLHRSWRPVAAVVETGAAGGGVELMLACDVRVAVGEVQLIFPFGDRGVVPDAFTTWRLSHLVGDRKAAELVTGTHRLSTTDAVELGLLDLVEDNVESAIAAAVGLARSRERTPRWPGLDQADPVAAAAGPMIASLTPEPVGGSQGDCPSC